MSSASTSSLSIRRAAPSAAASAASCSRSFCLQLGQQRVLQLGQLAEGVLAAAVLDVALGDLDLVLDLLELLLGLAQLADLALLLLPLALQRRRSLADVGELALERLESRLRRVVTLLAQRLTLDLELNASALELVELDGHRIHLHSQPAGRLVDKVDRLVGQEAIADVAIGQNRCRNERRVGDPNAVMVLVALAQSAQDRDRLLDRWLVDVDRLEAPFERGVLLDVLAVLVERGCADRVQLASREHRLEQVRGVHGALGGAGTDDGVQLVDEQDDLALGVLDLLEHGLEALLELAAIFRAGNQCAEVERDDALLL